MVGIDVVIAVFVFTGLSTADPHTAVLSYEALRAVAVWPLLTVGLLCLISGVVLGLGTRYGLLRYWWVAVKLAIQRGVRDVGTVGARTRRLAGRHRKSRHRRRARHR